MVKKLPLFTRIEEYIRDVLDNPKKLQFDISWKFRHIRGPLSLMACLSCISAISLAPHSLHLMPDPYKDMTPEQAIESVSTFEQAKNYNLRHLAYWEVNKPGANFEQVHKKRFGVCRDGTTAARALLSDDPKYRVNSMALYSRYSHSKLNTGVLTYLLGNHEVALVLDRETGKYGSLGINRADCIKPTLDSPEQVFDKLNFMKNFTSFQIYGKH
jgi:hypothetical protein